MNLGVLGPEGGGGPSYPGSVRIDDPLAFHGDRQNISALTYRLGTKQCVLQPEMDTRDALHWSPEKFVPHNELDSVKIYDKGLVDEET